MLRSVRSLLAAVMAAVLAMSTVSAATPSIVVESVGGQAVRNGAVAQPLTGTVDVRGSATLGGDPGSAPAAAPLVADAGDSPFVSAGARATLIGAAWGGVEPYTWAWSTSAGTIVEGADSATALLDTTGVAPGIYTATLTVRDSAGTTASDDVRVVVNRITRQVLLDETKEDLMPGVSLGVPAAMTFLDFPFEMPAGISSWEAEVTWTLEANDYDLHVVDPNGVEQDYSGNGATNLTLRFESGGTAEPMPGTWTLRMERFLTAADWVHAVVIARVSEPDPRPQVAAGGPYRFEIGAAQRLDGTVTGGTSPVSAAWDLDADGTFETAGTDVTASLAPGHHLVTLKATGADGLERRQTTSVLVADPERLAQDTTAITVIGIADSGINPYHLEFAAATYPDPDVLAASGDFTRHPSEYIKGYPASAEALNLTIGGGYFPAADRAAFDGVELGKLYWIPGTKIIGAIDANDSSASNAAADATPILDDDGHGTGSSSVSAGNRYGYCPTCLLFFVEGLDETIATSYPFVDITSHSFGYVGGVPIGPVLGPNAATREAAERGQIVLFAAGNGVGNAFDVPQVTYGSDQTGASWNITVGAIRRDNQRAIVGDGIPADISAWGDGNLPSACRTGTVGQCAFGGTSAATPYTAGIFGTVLTAVRREIGDPFAGQRPGQVVAEGRVIPESTMLADGKLTRAELREAVLKTALPLNQDNEVSTFPYPLTAPYAGEANVLFEGYGAATPEGARRAIEVILGRALMPDRSFEDEFFAIDQAVKDTLYGGYDRDGDGDTDFVGLAGTDLTPTSAASVEGAIAALRLAAARLGPAVETASGQNALTFYLHRRFVAEPDKEVSCNADDNESYLDTSNSSGDLECFENRVTSVPAAYRPLGIYAQDGVLDAPLPAGSQVYATVYVASETTTVGRATGVVMATDREIGTGTSAVQPILGFGTGDGSNAQGNPLPDGGGCEIAGELCWTKFDLSFETTRPAFAGEPLTFQIQLLGVRAYAFGHEGEHASRVTVVAAPMPPTGMDFGVTVDHPADGSTVASGSEVVAGGRVAFPDPGSDPTGAGDHPTTRRVEVSLDDPSFGSPLEAAWDEASATWSVPLGALDDGEHTIHARASMDQSRSDVASATFTVGPDARVEWQVVARNSAPSPARWATAAGLADWSFAFESADYGKGHWTIVTRLVEDGAETARATVRARIQ
jgi:PKD repeat protein